MRDKIKFIRDKIKNSRILLAFFYILIKFTMKYNYHTKAKGAWKYITNLKRTLNVETQILQKLLHNI